jgi:hypothetical protein
MGRDNDRKDEEGQDREVEGKVYQTEVGKREEPIKMTNSKVTGATSILNGQG